MLTIHKLLHLNLSMIEHTRIGTKGKRLIENEIHITTLCCDILTSSYSDKGIQTALNRTPNRLMGKPALVNMQTG